MNIRLQLHNMCPHCRNTKGKKVDTIKEIYTDGLLPHDRYSSGCGTNESMVKSRCHVCGARQTNITKTYYIKSDEEMGLC